MKKDLKSNTIQQPLDHWIILAMFPLSYWSELHIMDGKVEKRIGQLTFRLAGTFCSFSPTAVKRYPLAHFRDVQ